MPDLSPVTK